MNIEIHYWGENLMSELFGKPSMRVGDMVDVQGRFSLVYKGNHIRKAATLPEIATLVLTFSSGVGSGFVANWLYEKLRGKKVNRIVIERTEVELEEEKIKKVIEEKMTLDQQ